MNHLLDRRLAHQIRAYALRFTCDACAHLGDGDACSLGYPNDAHRRDDEAIGRAVDEADPARAEPRVRLTFCKEFELW